MAIVEDEVRNESEEENEIEVVVEEDDADQDSDDSDDDDDEEALERKVSDLELRIAKDPYNYNDHIELIEALWRLSELDRWRSAFDRLQSSSLLHPEHWLLRLQTEVTLGHSSDSREQIVALFEQATLDCYSIPILSEWCTWCLTIGDIVMTREQLDEVLRRAGADPLSGKIFWDAKLEFEKAQMEGMNESDSIYKEQRNRVLYCLEEIVSRPLLRSEEALPQFQEIATIVHGEEYVEKVKKQHERSVEFLEALTPYEDKLLTTENAEEKYKIYSDYIDTVKAFSEDDKFAECDCNGILRVLYDRATHECASLPTNTELVRHYAELVLRSGSRNTCARVLKACCRRAPRIVQLCIMRMQCEEKYGATVDEVKSIFENALSKGTDTYKDCEALWLGYLEFIRRQTDFSKDVDVERLRKIFRLAWDSLAEAWGEEANDSEIPLYWARLEYKRMKEPKEGKAIFEEIFKYGENKTMSKYWEQFIQLELSDEAAASERKLRDLFRRALKFVQDYPPSVARLWTDYERDYGGLSQLRDCQEACEAKLKEWRENYQALKEKMTGKKQKGKPDKQKDSNKSKNQKFDKKAPNKGKRKSDEAQQEGSNVKRKKDETKDIEMKEKDGSSGQKRTHEDSAKTEASGSKRQRTESESSGSKLENREACTLFVSNLEFKVDEQKLRDKLSQYGEIVSLRVRAGVKAFGGSICYCQYKTPESVDEAVKHDRTPLDGRPMFLSRYSASKSNNKAFKYATSLEKNKLFIKNLPFANCSKQALAEIYDKYGKLKDIRVVTYKDGNPKGYAYVEFEDESSAAKAVEATNGLLVGDRKIEVAISAPPPRGEGGGSRTDRREPTQGMRRTQLSHFIPSVLQKASTSKAANGNHGNGDSKQPMSNSDFRNMLLKK